MSAARRRLSAADLFAYAVTGLVDEMRVLLSQLRRSRRLVAHYEALAMIAVRLVKLSQSCSSG
jgi:hypothetical protein